MRTVKTQTTWKCDRCGKTVERAERPAGVGDCWGDLHFNREDGFDYQGGLVGPGPGHNVKRELCGKCGDMLMAFLSAVAVDTRPLVNERPDRHADGSDAADYEGEPQVKQSDEEAGAEK